MKFFETMMLAALAAGMPTAALAQPAASPHQHAQPAAPAQTPQGREHKGMQGADGGCDCCQMMTEMMQMMHSMHQHEGQPGAMPKMDMNQPMGSHQHGASPGDAGEPPKQGDEPKD